MKFKFTRAFLGYKRNEIINVSLFENSFTIEGIDDHVGVSAMLSVDNLPTWLEKAPLPMDVLSGLTQVRQIEILKAILIDNFEDSDLQNLIESHL